MLQITTVPLWLSIFAALVSLFLAALFRLANTALDWASRSSAVEGVQNNEISSFVPQLLEHRHAAKASASAMRVFFSAVLTLSIFFIALHFFHRAWELIGVTILAFMIVLALSNALVPVHFVIHRPLRVINSIAWVLLPLTKVAAKFVAARESEDDESEEFEDDQYALVVERVSEAEILEDDERDMINSVIELGRTIVRTVMVPRTDMITINDQHTLEQALSLFSRSGYSRVPVIGDSTDELVGVLYLKDLIRYSYRRKDVLNAPVTDVMREPYFVPETMLVDDLLHSMQATAVHIALVVDEYGGIAGLVTIEDLLEELVGEMVDEHDRAAQEVEEIGPATYRIPSRLPLDELGELFELAIEDDDVDTAGGLLAKALGRVPIVGSEVSVQGIHLEAERFEGRRRRITSIIASREEEHDDA